MKLEEVQKAAVTAFRYFETLQETLNDKVENVALEEVTVSENGNFWHITLGFDRYQGKREYKIFIINTESGDIESMKVRQF